MKFFKKIAPFLLSLMLMTVVVKTQAQTNVAEHYNSIFTQKIMLLKTPWSGSENAAALSFFDYETKLGSANIYSELQKKNYRLYREGDQLVNTGFRTEGFVKYNKWNFYGNFNYFSQNEKNIKWTDVMNPYNDNPYSIGDSVGGNYSKEYFDMEGKGSLSVNNNLTLGFDIKYSNGVGAKRKDPRPENTITSFTISPGLVLELNRFKIGTNFKYAGGKEDIKISDVTNNIFYIFHFKGLGVFSSSSDYDEQFYDSNLLGGGLQFNFEGNKLQNLTEINFHKKWIDIKRGETYPLQIALLERFNTEINSTFIFSPQKQNINRLNIFFTDKHIYGHEPVVEPELESVSYQWSTIAKYTLYWHKENTYSIKYSFYNLLDKNHINWGGQLSGSINHSETTYYFVPEFNRQELNIITLNTKVEKGFQIQKNDIVVKFNGSYQNNIKGSLATVKDEYLLSLTNTEMLVHDFNYFDSEIIQLGICAKVGRDISFYQKQMQAFLETEFNKTFSKLEGNPKSTIFKINLGINF